MTHLYSTRRISLLPLAVAAVVFTMAASCAARVDPDVEALRTTYLRASTDPLLRANAADDLNAVDATLDRAEEVASRGGDPREIDHLVYMARRRLELAQTRAAYAQARQQIAQAGGSIAQWITQLRESGVAVPEWLSQLPLAGEFAANWWRTNLSDPQAAAEWLRGVDVQSITGWTRALGGELLYRLFHFLLTLVALFFMFRDGAWLAQQASTPNAGQRDWRMTCLERSAGLDGASGVGSLPIAGMLEEDIARLVSGRDARSDAR